MFWLHRQPIAIALLLAAMAGGIAMHHPAPWAGPVVYSTVISGFPSQLLLDVRTRRAFLVDFSNPAGSAMSVTTMDLDTGARMCTVQVGIAGGANPDAVLDERHDRLIVASAVYTTPAAPGMAGRVTVLDARSGALQCTVTVGDAPSIVALDPSRERAFVLNTGVSQRRRQAEREGSVTVLDTRTGTILSTLPAGVAPDGLTVDTVTGHVIVLSQGGTIVPPDRWSWVPAWLRNRLLFLSSKGGSPHAQLARLIALNPTG